MRRWVAAAMMLAVSAPAAVAAQAGHQANPARADVAARRSTHATVREYRKTIRTYPFGNPDPLPVFGRIYPYFRYDGYTDTAVDREWTVVELENEYLRVTVLPEIGGKVWSAIEKSTGKAFIYDNHVVKFRDVAMRGPWTSGGLEPNYGIIGHTPNCATPVDYTASVDADGTATVTVGTLDLLTRTAWRLRIALPADAAYFTTGSLWQNASGLEQPYYTWMNTGIKAAGGLEFAFPGTRYLGHAGEVGAWPTRPEDGRNLSSYDRNDFGSYKSYHVFGESAGFWGAYWHDDGIGMARWSPRDEKLGKKIWIWGLSRQGMIWEHLLTDADGQYVEVQSGRLFNQAAEASTRTPFKHRGFLPYATDTWTEYWMPVLGTEGLVEVNDLGALNVSHEPGGVVLAFSPVQRLETTVEVFDGDRLVERFPVSFTPMRTWLAMLPVVIPAERLRVRIGGGRFDYAGNRSLRVLARPVEAPSDFDWESAYGRWLTGKELLRQREYERAEQAIDDALTRDRHYVPALADKSLLRLRAGDAQAAFDAASRGLAVDTYDPQANYYYGLSALGLGREADARDGFDVAAQDSGYRGAALVQLARISIRSRRLHDAEDYASRAIEADHAGTEAPLLLAVARRLAGRPAEARAALDDVLARDPLSHGARFEASRLQTAPVTHEAFVGAIRNELRHETFLELASWYVGLGLEDDAREVLSGAPEEAEVLYWRAWLDRNSPSRAGPLLARAADASPRLVFPFRPESRAVFEWAMARPSSGWKPAYYLALLERGLGNLARARSLVTPLGSTPDEASFYVFRAELDGASASSLVDLQRAASLDAEDWRIGKRLVDRAVAEGRLEDAVHLAAAYHSADPLNYMAGMAHARTLILDGKTSDALAILGRLQVLPYEGATDGRALWREAHLILAVRALGAGEPSEVERHVSAAREWPEHLGAGKPYPEDCDERLEDWLLSESLRRRGAPAEARRALERVVSSKAERTAVGAVITALALAALARTDEVDAVLGSPEVKSDPATARWVRAAAAGSAAAPPPSVASSGEYRIWQAFERLGD